MPLLHFVEAMQLLAESDDETSDDRSPPTMVSCHSPRNLLVTSGIASMHHV